MTTPNAGSPAPPAARFTRFVDALAAESGVPRPSVGRLLAHHPPSVAWFLMASYELGEQAGFDDAFRLITALERLGCRELHVPDPEQEARIAVHLRRGDGVSLTVDVARLRLALSPGRLAEFLRTALTTSGAASSGTPPDGASA